MKNISLIMAMAKLGLNDSDLAKKSGVSRVTINKLCNGKTEGSVHTWVTLAKVLGVDVSDLIMNKVKHDINKIKTDKFVKGDK